MAHGTSAAGSEEAHHGAARYVVVWLALVVLTGVTFMAWRVKLPEPWHLLVALAIAGAKALLVVLFFMHLWDHRGPSRLVLATSLVFVALLIGLVVADNATRFPLANPPRDGNYVRTGILPEPAPALPSLPEPPRVPGR